MLADYASREKTVETGQMWQAKTRSVQKAVKRWHVGDSAAHFGGARSRRGEELRGWKRPAIGRVFFSARVYWSSVLVLPTS